MVPAVAAARLSPPLSRRLTNHRASRIAAAYLAAGCLLGGLSPPPPRSSARSFFAAEAYSPPPPPYSDRVTDRSPYHHSRMPSVTERTGDGTVTVSPKNEADQSATVVICHGLGDTAEGFVDVAEHLASQMPYVKFILPTAPTQPVTMNMGMPMPSWYDIVGLDERSNENCKGLDVSVERLRSILRTEHEGSGLPYSRMVLAGFSQGGALSLFTGLQLEKDRGLAGILLMSGYLPCAKKFKVTEGLEDTPVLHCHGESDPMVLFDMAKKSREHALEHGAGNYEMKSYPGLVHSVSPEEISDVLVFIRKILPPDESCRVKLKDPKEMSVKELKAAIRKAGLGSKAVGLMEKSEFVKLLQDHREGKS